MFESKELVIYHLVTKDDFKKKFNNGLYESSNYQADGFIHCSSKDSVIDIAEDYYSTANDLMLIKIHIGLLKSVLKYEEPVPINRSNSKHIKKKIMFPHIYGPINEHSIIGIGEMKNTNGRYKWPSKFINIKSFF